MWASDRHKVESHLINVGRTVIRWKSKFKEIQAFQSLFKGTHDI